MKITSRNNQWVKTIRVGATASALIFTGTSFAQEGSPEGPTNTERALEEVYVTGTRIKHAAVTASAPLQVLDAGMIEDQASLNIQDVLQTNPSFGIPGASRHTSRTDVTAAGSSTVNLRNLGADRTLVLVDGKRMVAGQPGTTQVDLAMIPTDFIESVEVLTGGASAAYGSDALAGVVNIIYKKNFEGITFNAQSGISEEGDDEQHKLSLTAGHNFADDRGNFMVNVSWAEQGLVSASDRSRSEDDFLSLGHVNRDPSTVFERTLSRSGVIPAGIVQTTDASGVGRNWTFDPSGNASIWEGTQEESFNRNEYRAIASPVDRKNFSMRASYEVTDNMTTFIEGSYAEVGSQAYLEPSPFVMTSDVIGVGVPLNLENRLINPDTGEVQVVRNPLIPEEVLNSATDSNGDGLRDAGFNRRLTQFGSGTRLAPVDRDSFRLVLGTEGSLGDWLYDTSYSYGRTQLAGRMTGLFHGPNLTAALTAAEDVFDFDSDGDTTEAICVGQDARQRGCIPANMFGEGSMTPEMLDYVNGSLFQDSEQDMHVVAGNISGPLFELPAGPLLLATGFEYREESSSHLFDPLSNTHQNGYTQQTDTVGELDVTEAYFEVNVPLITDAPLAKELSVRAAGRVSDYSTVGNVTSYDGGIEWFPIEDLRFRAGYAKAVRAPNIGELFAAESAGSSAITDPCEGITANDTSALAQNCLAAPGVQENINANDGVLTLNQSDVQGVMTVAKNNPNIEEETGETVTFGFVYTPSFIPGLVLTVDHYDIEVEDAIARVDTGTILEKCYRDGLSEFCDFVSRRAVQETPYSVGSVSQIIQGLVNSGGAWSEGVDVTASYSHEAFNGQMSYSLSWTHLLDKGLIPLVGEPENDATGEIGDAENKMFASVSYDVGRFSANLSGQYIGDSYIDDSYWQSRFGADAGRSNFKVDGVLYADAQLKYRLGDEETYEVYIGGKNLLDEDPAPLLGGVEGGSADSGTNTGVYDAIGRRWYAGVRVSF